MMLLGKKRDEIDFTFIRDQLVSGQVAENYRLEYKGGEFLSQEKLPEKILKDKWNLAKKICGFANTQGGFIIFGVEEFIKGKEHIPGPISGTEIENIAHVVPWVIHKAIHSPPHCVLSPPIENPSDPTRPLYVLEVQESPVPVMLWWDGCPHKGSFPIRRNDATDVADITEVEMLFRKTAREREFQRRAQFLYGLLSEATDLIVQAKVQRVGAILRRMLVYRQESTELDVVPINEPDNLGFHLLNGKFTVADGAIIDLDALEDHVPPEKLRPIVLKELKEYWARAFNIYVD